MARYRTVIKQVQTFYAEQMQANGYGNKTFRIETDAQGEPLVHRVDGQHPFSHYDNTLGNAVIDELDRTFDLDANIYFIVLGTDALRQGTVCLREGSDGGGRKWRPCEYRPVAEVAVDGVMRKYTSGNTLVVAGDHEAVDDIQGV